MELYVRPDSYHVCLLYSVVKQMMLTSTNELNGNNEIMKLSDVVQFFIHQCIQRFKGKVI